MTAATTNSTPAPAKTVSTQPTAAAAVTQTAAQTNIVYIQATPELAARLLRSEKDVGVLGARVDAAVAALKNSQNEADARSTALAAGAAAAVVVGGAVLWKKL